MVIIKYSRLSIVLLILVFVAGSLFFYAENPNMFQLSFHKAGSGEVSLIVVPAEKMQLDADSTSKTHSPIAEAGS